MTDGLLFPDLDSGSYRVSVDRDSDACSVRLTSPVCHETHMELTRAVSVSSEGRIGGEQAMTNRSPEAVTWGLWDVTQVRGPGLAPQRCRRQLTSWSARRGRGGIPSAAR